MPHFSLAFFAIFNIRPVVNEITKVFTATLGLSKERPRCAGKPLVVGSTTYTLPSRYLSKSDGVLWPCLRADGQNVSVDLVAASGLLYLVRVSPKASLTYGGITDFGKATILSLYRELIHNAPYTQGLLVPGATISYSFKGSTLPGTIAARVAVGTQLALSAVWGAQCLLTIFGKKIELLEKFQVLSCIGDVVEAATPPEGFPSGAALGGVLKAATSCGEQVIKAEGGVVTTLVASILSVLAGGAGLVISGLQGAVRTGLRHDTTTLQIGRTESASLADSPFAGDWFVHGGSLEIRAGGTATLGYRYGTCTSNPDEDCRVEQTLAARLSTDGKTLTMTVRKVNYLAYVD
ncbi:hypothetical protein AB0L70_40635 [Kribbella sp. NPDC051952]|uniref:hypothetical protein n=1 Tax=Kribbella sp. NPDC051952 TaxID=3154851 RepID=UPI003412EAA5